MAKFYLTDVPTTPKASSRSRPANIPKEPYQVQGRPPTMPQINAQVQDINIEKNIPSLMQKELPREVSSGLVEGVQETGRAQARTGRASAAAAEAWGKAAEKMSQSMSEVAIYLQKSKDLSDASRAKNAMDLVDAQFDEAVSKGNLNGADAMKLWPEYEAKLNTQLESMNLSKHVKDKALPDAQIYTIRKRTALQDGMRKEQISSDTAAIETRIASDVNKGDIDSAVAGVEDMFDAKLINAGQREKKIAEVKTGYDEYRARTQIESDPRLALSELERAAQTGKSDLYPNLPISSIQALHNMARAKVEANENDTLDKIANGVARNELKTTQQIDDAAGGNVEAHKLESLKAKVLQPVDAEYSQEAMIKIETAISTYVKEAPDTGSPQMHQIKEMIYKTAPKNEWERLIGDLNKKRSEEKDALPGEDWFNPVVKDIEQLADDGAFAGPRKPPMYIFGMGFGGGQEALDMSLVNKGDTDPKARAYRLEHKAEIEKMYKDARSIQIQLREWRKQHPGNDHKTQDEAYKFRNDLLSTHGADAARAPIRKAVTVPERPYTMGTPGPTTSSLAPPVRQQREAIMSQLDSDPATKKLAMQMLDTEGGGVATMEALVNRVAMIREKVPDWTIKDELNSGFYGPIKRGYAQTVALDKSRLTRYQQDIDAVRSGSNVIRGRTDQGYPGDPNWRGPGRVHVADNPKEVYNYWTGKRRGVQFSHEDAARHASSYG